VEVPTAVRAEERDGRLVCLDQEGAVVSSFSAAYVSAFTSDPVMVEAIEEEVCDDLVVIPPGANHEGGATRH
jgi:hydroxyethylthiazole kinase-like sugar kinase family protein